MFKRLKRLFKRKKHAPVYLAGGYPTNTDLQLPWANRARSGEYVVNTKQQEAFTVRKRVMDSLKEMEDKEVAVTEEEVSEAFANAIGERFRYIQKKMKHSMANCPNCGAVMHGNICDYCGTEL